jgi:hypothetical protein
VKRGLLLLLLLLFLLPGAAATEETEAAVQKVRSRLEEAGYSLDNGERLLSLLDDAQQRDIPITLVIPRIFEGTAKNVPLPRITTVIESEIVLLTRARDLLRSIPGSETFLHRPPLWQRTAHLLEKELEVEEIRQLVRVTLPDPGAYRPASALFISLTSWGLPPKAAHRVIDALMNSPIPPQQFAGIPRLYNRARAQRISPERLTERIVEAAPSSENIEELEKRTIME